VFWQFAKSHGADYIATGHYAVNNYVNKNSFREAMGVGALPSEERSEGRDKELRKKLFLLKQSLDETKDQSYFLWTLTQEDLAHTLFPIGHLNKTKVRKIAKKNGLPTAEKKDSQGVCFLGPLDMKDFLSHYIKPKKGKVLNIKKEVIGYHEGAVFFTLGERHGFTITKKSSKDQRYYMVGKNVKKNTITVSNRSDLGEDPYRLSQNSGHLPLLKGEGKTLTLINTNWISGVPKDYKLRTTNYKCQIRYHGEYFNCNISCIGQTYAKVEFKPARTAKQGGKNVLVAPGQSIVVYDKDVCLGGGVVK
jgi:tRNA-specific 2-thiouridylase